MHKLPFSRLELTHLMRSHGLCALPSVSSQLRRLHHRLWDLLGNIALCGFAMSADRFLAIPPQGLRALAEPLGLWRAPVVLFRPGQGVWSAQCVLSCEPGRNKDPAIEEAVFMLLSGYEVEYLPLTHELIDGGYLDCTEFRKRLRRAYYAPCTVPPRPLPSLLRVQTMLQQTPPSRRDNTHDVHGP